MSEVEKEFELIYTNKKGIVDFLLGFIQAKGEWIPSTEFTRKNYAKTLYVFEKEVRDVIWFALRKDMIKG